MRLGLLADIHEEVPARMIGEDGDLPGQRPGTAGDDHLAGRGRLYGPGTADCAARMAASKISAISATTTTARRSGVRLPASPSSRSRRSPSSRTRRARG